MGPSTGIFPSTGTESMRKVLLNCTCCTPWMTLATKIAKAGANMFNAVPLMVWSAFILIAA